ERGAVEAGLGDGHLALDGDVDGAPSVLGRLAVEVDGPELALRVVRPALGRGQGVADPERERARGGGRAVEEALVVAGALAGEVAREVRRGVVDHPRMSTRRGGRACLDSEHFWGTRVWNPNSCASTTAEMTDRACLPAREGPSKGPCNGE